MCIRYQHLIPYEYWVLKSQSATFTSTGGALVPITSFGHSLVHGAMAKSNSMGFIGIFTGMFDLTAAGITSAIIFYLFLYLFLNRNTRLDFF